MTPNRSFKAETFFSVRVRMGVPPRGFGGQQSLMLGWIEENLGRPSGRDLMLFYFLDPVSADAFIGRFACGLTVYSDTSVEARPS